MSLSAHLMTCHAASAMLSASKIHQAVVKERTGFSQIIFRKHQDGQGLSLMGFDWYVRKGSFGLSIQGPFDAELAHRTFLIEFPDGVDLTDALGNTFKGRWQPTRWNDRPAVQLIFGGVDNSTPFPNTELGEYQRALYRGALLAQLIEKTLPTVRTLVAAKIAAQTMTIEYEGDQPEPGSEVESEDASAEPA